MSWIRPLWVQKFYAGFGSKLQKYYNIIDKWEWSPEIKMAIQTLCDMLPNSLALGLIKYINTVYKKLGPVEAERWVIKILSILNNFSF